jgi:hypothetical protein
LPTIKLVGFTRETGDRNLLGNNRFGVLYRITIYFTKRARHLEEERRREQPLKLRFFLPGGRVAEEKDVPINPWSFRQPTKNKNRR